MQKVGSISPNVSTCFSSHNIQLGVDNLGISRAHVQYLGMYVCRIGASGGPCSRDIRLAVSTSRHLTQTRQGTENGSSPDCLSRSGQIGYIQCQAGVEVTTSTNLQPQFWLSQARYINGSHVVQQERRDSRDLQWEGVIGQSDEKRAVTTTHPFAHALLITFYGFFFEFFFPHRSGWSLGTQNSQDWKRGLNLRRALSPRFKHLVI